MRARIGLTLLLVLAASPLAAMEAAPGVPFQLAAAVAQDLAGSDAEADTDEGDLYDPQVRVCPDGGYESGCDREDIEHAMKLDENLPQNLAAECLFATKAECTPISYGTLLPTAQPSTIVWQLMSIQPADGPQIEMLAMVETEGAISNLLAAAQTEGWYDPPAVVRDSEDVLMIHAPGRSGGTGMGNVDVLLTRHGGSWTVFDVNDLLEEASALLPEGFSLAGGVDFDFREMFASVPVKRAGDGGCCATGGVAYVDFALPEPNWMEVGSITFNETRPVETRHIEPGESADEAQDD